MITRVAALACLLFVAAAQATTAQTAPAQYVLSADTVKFMPLDPKDPGGINVSVVSGQLQGKGPVTFFMRLPKGPAPLHIHSASYHGTLVRGQAKHWPAGGQAKAQVLNPGSHWFQPGKAAHGDECLSAECLLLVQFESGFDFTPAPVK